MISPGSWLGYGADIRSEGNALLMKQHLPALLQGLLLWQQCLTQAQPHHKTQMQTTGEFRLVTLAAMSFLYTALEGPSQAPFMHTHPRQDIRHDLHPACTEHCVPYRELNTAAEHVLNSNTWVILLMISSCLSALLDLSQSALRLAKLSSKWDKTSPMR